MNRVPISINIKSISESFQEIKKAKSYVRTKRGKLERVKGYSGRLKSSLQPEKQMATQAFEKRLDEYKKKLAELEAWDVKKEPLANRKIQSYVEYMKGRIENFKGKIKELEVRINDLGGKVTARPTHKPETPSPTPPPKERPAADFIDLTNEGKVRPSKFYRPTSAQIAKVKNFVMNSDLTDYETPREQKDWVRSVVDLANAELFDGKLKNINVGLLSFKSKRTLGLYRPSQGDVAINPRYFLSNQNLLAMHETIVHELCHKATRELENADRGNPHGWAWQQWMERVGLVASRLNYHDIDIDTTEEKAAKKKEEKAKAGEKPVESWDLRPLQLVKFNNKGRWIIAKLVKRMSGRDRWFVATAAGNTWRVSSNHMFKLTSAEEKEAANFSTQAVEATQNLLAAKAERRRSRSRHWRWGF